MEELTVVTYNSTGLGGFKCEFISEVIQNTSADIVLLQETWLVPGNLDKLSSIHPDFISHGVSGIRDNELLTGRPYGGIAILYHKNISPFVKHVSVNSRRICAIRIECVMHKLLIVNGYLPVDNWNKSHVSDDFLNVIL